MSELGRCYECSTRMRLDEDLVALERALRGAGRYLGQTLETKKADKSENGGEVSHDSQIGVQEDLNRPIWRPRLGTRALGCR